MSKSRCNRICDKCRTTFICGPMPCSRPGCGGKMITYHEDNARTQKISAQHFKLAAAKEAVVKAAMDCYRARLSTDIEGEYIEGVLIPAEDAACAALAKLEREG